jgi:hypothetical protein
MSILRAVAVRVGCFLVLATLLARPAHAQPLRVPPVAASAKPVAGLIPANAQTATVEAYLRAMHTQRYDDAFRLLNRAERSYYKNALNFASVYAADAYAIRAFALVGSRADGSHGRVYFARETARFRDHAHDADLVVTATVPIGVVPEADSWRIKDPGHPWRAFAAKASASGNGVTVTVKKMSFFARRIEIVVSFVNAGPRFVTILPYGRSALRDAAGQRYEIIATKDWSLTDKTLFEGLRLPPNSQYTGLLQFADERRATDSAVFSLTVAPLLIDGADEPFALNVDSIAAGTARASAQK